ncbi:MAG: hypothetical protein KDI01_07405 [Halioglobus sp.]|nr:hypothetical protein [Halioglobus sp.]
MATSEQFKAWLAHLAQLDASARALEYRNLGWGRRTAPELPAPRELQDCRNLLSAQLLADRERRMQLLRVARVPDDYVTGWRIAGLYPLTSQFVAMGVRRGQNASREVFAQALEALPVRGRLQRWRSPAVRAAAKFDPALDPLGIPLLTAAQVSELFRQHAPIWEVDVVDDNDRIGTAVWRDAPAVDTAVSTQYQKLSYTRFGSDVLLQLNYVIWFRSRPGDDLFAGRIDGLVWRVTLGPDGEPWLYDSIHNCGCYHTFIPTQHLRLRGDLPVLDFEPPLVPQGAPAPPLVVRVASGTHYLQRVYSAAGAGASHLAERQAPRLEELLPAHYDRLHSLPAAQGYRSYFGEHGIVEGSERGERFILWPMGVRSPGAMRAWGHHAVAFVGRRHFDDARLIESLFVRTAP